MRKGYIILLLLFVSGCVKVPDGVESVKDFELNRYLGKWYEIARLDHSFERGLTKVSAEYSLRDDGGVRVLNRGFNLKENRWDEVEGKAFFAGDAKTGELKVSFFGPFYASYNIIELDKAGYKYALVCGPDRSYLRILSRTPKFDKMIIDRLVQKAGSLGFDTGKLIYVEQD